MLQNHYKKYQYFYNLLVFNIFWSIIRITQWIEFQPENLSLIFKYIALELLIVQALSLVMIAIYKWSSKHKPIVSITAFIIISLIGPALLFIISNGIKLVILPQGILAEFNFEQIKLATYYQVMFFSALGGIFFVTQFRINYLKQKEQTTKAETLAKDTQLKMLRYQINPHFLFNILNSLHALIDENKETAKKLIVDISEYYRSILDKQIQKHSIKNEVEIIEKYLEIQKIRFEESFEYQIKMHDKASTYSIPTFIVHLLVENAIKYGLKGEDNKLTVLLDISLVESKLTIMVKNTGKIPETAHNVQDKPTGTKKGLENITQRLQLFYDEDYSFSLLEDNGWVIARIEIYENNK